MRPSNKNKKQHFYLIERFVVSSINDSTNMGELRRKELNYIEITINSEGSHIFVSCTKGIRFVVLFRPPGDPKGIF